MDGGLNLADTVRHFREQTVSSPEVIDDALDSFHTRMILLAWQAVHLPMVTPLWAHFFHRKGHSREVWHFDHFSVSRRHYRSTPTRVWSAVQVGVYDIRPGDSPDYWHLRIKMQMKAQGEWYVKKNSPSSALDPWLRWWLEGPGYILGERGADEAVVQGPQGGSPEEASR